MAKFFRFLPAIIWMGIIFYLSSGPTDSVPIHDTTSRFIFFKSLHVITYAILYSTYFLASKKRGLSLFLTILYGITDEFHQSYVPGRTARVTDLIFDSLGGVLGLLLMARFRYSKRT